jgi:hypothetical protein
MLDTHQRSGNPCTQRIVRVRAGSKLLGNWSTKWYVRPVESVAVRWLNELGLVGSIAVAIVSDKWFR